MRTVCISIDDHWSLLTSPGKSDGNKMQQCFYFIISVTACTATQTEPVDGNSADGNRIEQKLDETLGSLVAKIPNVQL